MNYTSLSVKDCFFIWHTNGPTLNPLIWLGALVLVTWVVLYYGAYFGTFPSDDLNFRGPD